VNKRLVVGRPLENNSPAEPNRSSVVAVSSSNDRPSLNGKIGLVTGASSGIGAACARTLAAEGATVVVGYHQGEARAEAVRAELPGSGHRTLRIPLADSAAHAEIARALTASHGQLDFLVNSAGFTRRIPHADLEALDPALFNEILTVNAGGTFSITRALLPLLRASGSATVVTVSSVSAFTGLGSNIAYCAAKAAMDVMSVSMARAFGPELRFLSVSPASVDTDFVPGRSRDEMVKKAAGTPLGRIVSPDDVALAVLACITHLRTATGTRIVIDGGHSL
jgi:3-oxoacyl-[acyl-carrier protein] reductase